MTLWLYLHFPRLQLDSLYQADNQAPIIVVDGHQHSVVQCNDKAMDAGIRPGMGLATAASLHRELEVLEYQPALERDKLTELAQQLYQLTCDISLMPPNGLLLRISNMLALYDGLANYWEVVGGQLNNWSLRIRYATGYSPLAARLLARAGANEVTDSQKRLSTLLHRQPLAATELNSASQEKLKRVGLGTLGELLPVPLAELAKRFDIDVINYLGRLSGQLRHPQRFYHPPDSFERYLELLYEIRQTQTLEGPLSKLLAQLEQFLKTRDQLTQAITLQLHQRDAAPLSVTISSAQGEYQAGRWWTLAALHLEKLVLTAPVHALTLTTGPLIDQQADQGDLLNGSQSRQSPLQLISLLQAKLGNRNISGISLSNDFRPERATQSCPPLSTEGSEPPGAGLRPSLLLPRPRPLNEQVALHQGPERIVTGWWDQQQIMRDYFVARSADGQWLWIFKTPQSQWFVHGYFS